VFSILVVLDWTALTGLEWSRLCLLGSSGRKPGWFVPVVRYCVLCCSRWRWMDEWMEAWVCEEGVMG